MKYYITKYALTKGIIEVEGELTEDKKYVRGKWPGTSYPLFVPAIDAWPTKRQAILRHRDLIRTARKSVLARGKKLEKAEAALDELIAKGAP